MIHAAQLRDDVQDLGMVRIDRVLFDLDPNRPEYDIRVRAQRFFPDWFYVNELAERLKQHNGETFEKLFG